MTACGFCGRENQDGARFCIDCGKSVAPSAARILSPLAVQSAAASLEAKRASAGSAGTAGGAGSTLPLMGAPVMGAPAPPAGGARRSSLPGLGSLGAPGATAGAGGAGGAAGSRVACKTCGELIDAGLPFCAHCGARTGAPTKPTTPAAGAAVQAGAASGTGPKLVLLDDAGQVKQSFSMPTGEAVVGRSDGDIQFSEDVYLSPVHAQFSLREGQLWVRDLGSRNGTWVFIDGPHRMLDGDVMLVGSQLLRFRRLGYPGPHPPEADRTRRLGSLTPTADIAVLAQLRADGSVRDTFHLSPGRNILIGRESGDWLFPYDQTMSATHAEVRSEDSDFVVADAGSRNGVAVAVRGERALRLDQRVLLGDRVLRVEQL